MIIYPAIDLRDGKVVRLREGDPNRQTTFSDDPIATAQHWLNEGAIWLHLVNLDGAFAEANDNSQILEAIAKFDVNIQFGGGLRDLSAIEQALNSGADRVIIGTLAIKEPEIVEQAVELFGADAICVALDARDGKITTHGWQEVTEQTPIEFGQRMVEMGVQHALFTDVQRDGGLSGVNVEASVNLSKATGLQVIASGGISSLDDIRELSSSGQVAGAVTGMALYEKKFSLQEAIELANQTSVG